MTDLEMVRLCAEAIDLGCYETTQNKPEHTIRLNGSTSQNYWPLTNDAQAMALEDWLVERGKLEMKYGWYSYTTGENHSVHVAINSAAYGPKARRRFIVECVAKIACSQSEAKNG